jgi:hypothetical protein
MRQVAILRNVRDTKWDNLSPETRRSLVSSSHHPSHIIGTGDFPLHLDQRCFVGSLGRTYACLVAGLCSQLALDVARKKYWVTAISFLGDVTPPKSG